MKKKLNILFCIHEVSYLDKPIYEMHEFAELLSQRGHGVSFIQFAEGYKFWKARRPARHQIIAGRVYPKSSINLYTPFQLGIPGVDRILAIFTFIPLLISVFKLRQVDVIVNYAVPTFGIQANFLARHNNVPLVFRALDISHKIRKTLLAPLIRQAEKSVYANATVISANNPGLGLYCAQMGSRSNKSITNLPPLDLKHFAPQERATDLASSLNLTSSDRVIIYMGSFFYFSGLKRVIRAFSKYAEEDSKLLVLGGGEQDEELRTLVKELNLESKIKFTGFVNYSELPRYFSLAHVAINPMEPNLVTHSAFPHKVLQYIASGIPVVSTDLRGLRALFGDASGITWANSPEEVFIKAQELSNSKMQMSIASMAQTTIAKRLFGIENALADFENTLREAIRVTH